MDQEKRKKLLWAILILVIILAFLFWILRTSDQNPNNINSPEEQQPVFTPPSANIEYQAPEEVEQNPTEFSAVNLAKAYAARFGSWSTDNQGNNLQQLFPLSTSRMQNYLSSIDLNFENQEFFGATTKSISAEIVDMNDNSAEVLVNTQKIETNASLERNVYYQEASVYLLKSGDNWLVDRFVWE